MTLLIAPKQLPHVLPPCENLSNTYMFFYPQIKTKINFLGVDMEGSKKDPPSKTTDRAFKQYELPKSYFKKKFSCEPKMKQILTFFNRCKSSFQDWCRAHTDLDLGFQCDMALPSLLSNHLFSQLHPPARTNNNKTS